MWGFRMNVLQEIKNDLDGAQLLGDWLGDEGHPVSQMVAEARSKRCTRGGKDGAPCPKNVAPKWWETTKGAVAEWIRGELALKHAMELKVSEEDNLHMCSACGCAMRLKVWVPTEHLKRHTSQKVINMTPDFCWMRSELGQ